MYRIVMDTSNQYLIVGLYQDDIRLEGYQKKESKRQSENAIPVLQDILERHQLSLLDIDEMIITQGPGSYTGVRVAMTIAKTLSVISDIKIKVISSLLMYANHDQCICLLDARGKKAFVGMYENAHTLLETMMTLEECQTFINEHKDYEVRGQLSLINRDEKEHDLLQHLFELSKDIEPVEHVDILTPAYIKEVEAKKICY